MIDFIKIQVKDTETIQFLKDSSKLIWQTSTEQLSHFDFETIFSKETKIYNGIIFCFYDNYLNILMRPHYYFNDNKHNANDFKVCDSIQVIKEFINEFDINNFDNFKIVNIEFGLNFLFKPYGKDLVVFSEYHKRNLFVTDIELPYSKKSYSMNKTGSANKYKIIKLYSKGLQYPKYCNPETLRLEVKSKMSKYIKTLDISDIGDLLNPSSYNRMNNEILNVVDELLILDNKTIFKNLTKRQSGKLKEYLNTHTWYITLQKGRNEFLKKKKRYFELLDKTDYNIHLKLKKVVLEKLKYLSFNQIEKGAYSTTITESKKDAYSTIYKGGIRTHVNIQICPVTGLSLEHEKNDPKFIRTSTFKYLKKNDQNKFIELCSILLSNTKGKQPKYEKDIFSYLAKQVRNRFYSQFEIKQSGYNQKQYPNQLELFNINI